MADEAFALSPISARAAEPREEDYDAISAAFMETSRGRWFLGEYAKRNRNADTRMVLDAVARIEQNIASQKPSPPDNKLAEALTAIRAAVDAARSAAFDTFDGFALEEKLAPLRKGARIIHEIAWRWREIGADSRICDLLDAQVRAIETSCEEITSLDARFALTAAFDLIQRNIEEVAGGDTGGKTAVAPSTDASPAPAPAFAKPVEAAGEPTAASSQMAETQETGPDEPALGETALGEAALGEAALGGTMLDEVASAEAATPDAMAETTEAHFGVDDNGYDEAILDAVALEMAIAEPVEPKRVAPTTEHAPHRVTARFDEIDDVEIHFVNSPEDTPVAEPAPVHGMVPQQPVALQPQTLSHQNLALPDEIMAPEQTATPEPVNRYAMMAEKAAAPAMEMARAPEVAQQSLPDSVMKPVMEVSPEMSGEISLGSSLLANGIVKKPGKITAPDPMAALRRLTQTEKIALFS